MAKVNCIIIDDESVARKGLEKYVDRIEYLNLVASCKSALQAIEHIDTGNIDLLFLDINMPHIKGTDFLRTLQKSPFVAFTTAYSEYALESFEFNVVDYLVKPIAFDRFLQCTNKVKSLLEKTGKEDDYFFINYSKKLIKLEIDEIVFIESDQNYVKIHTRKGDQLMTQITLKSVLDQLPQSTFIQVHRQHIVNIKHISSLEGNRIFLGEKSVTISRRMREEVIQKISRNKILK